jgi:hypothetical protein
VASLFMVCSCRSEQSGMSEAPLFSLLQEKHTGIDFINQIEYTEEYNTYTYRNFYNGAGVGLGDFNNDGFPDIYFCSNQAGNRLYLNMGDFIFEDITEKAGVSCAGSWSTGVAIADVNGDGWTDIYVCKSGNPESPHRHNELFINNGDLTFSEKAAEYGLEIFGLSNHASFFDYDKDGDLDCYLLNNSFQSVTDFDMTPGQRLIADTLGGNKLFRNEDGHFVDRTTSAGIYSSKIGFGLGVTVGDVNRDGWLDIYVANDFFERDYLYINNKNCTFKEVLEDQMNEISAGAMGADMADINNDGWPEIFATEMTPQGNSRLKTKALFESWENYQIKYSSGYHRQFARNVLQLNNKNGSFSEIGRYSGVSSTDWSWGALIIDLDNDGWKDIFVANGIFKDLLDRDFLDIYSNPSIMRSLIKSEQSAILRLIDMIPSVRIPNYAFHNNGDLTFTNLSDVWGLNTPSFSNGAAYGDLDNDGDLDLVVNNVNMPAFIYRNETSNRLKTNFINLKLKGEGQNTEAIGAHVTLFYDGKISYQELIPARGFQSCIDNRLHFGLGTAATIDSIQVVWPGGRCSSLKDVAVNQFVIINEKDDAVKCPDRFEKVNTTLFSRVGSIDGLDYKHIENDFVDFDRDRLLFRMMSNEGPHIATGDVNNDGYEDIYVCGAKDSPGALYIQNGDGRFKRSNEELFEADKISEDTDCVFFDVDNDGDNDLYVTSGGNEFPSSSSALIDRLYLNDGKGKLIKSGQMLPVAEYISSSCVSPGDFDSDGDADLFIGTRLRPFEYGIPANGYLLENDGNGNLSDVTKERAPRLTGIGMITDMVWADVDNDNDSDMVIVGDWMPVKVFINDKGLFKDESERFGLNSSEGWWNVIIPEDLNKDGYIDFILGNHGLNSYFRATEKQPITMFVNDFDLNGTIEQIICVYNGDISYPVVMKDELVRQIPSLENKYSKFDDYKEQTIDDIFSPEVIQRSIKLSAKYMESCIMINTGNESFRLTSLPAEAQFTPVYAAIAGDFNSDGICDIIIGGNQYRAKPQSGIYGAGYGLFLKGTIKESWEAVPPSISGFNSRGEIRDLKLINLNGTPVVAVTINNDNLQFYKY